MRDTENPTLFSQHRAHTAQEAACAADDDDDDDATMRKSLQQQFNKLFFTELLSLGSIRDLSGSHAVLLFILWTQATHWALHLTPPCPALSPFLSLKAASPLLSLELRHFSSAKPHLRSVCSTEGFLAKACNSFPLAFPSHSPAEQTGMTHVILLLHAETVGASSF